MPEIDVRRLLKLLARLGQRRRDRARPLLPARDRRRDGGRSPPTSRRRPTTGEFTAAQFRDRLDNGRKVAIQILEFFDRHGVTMRRGDLRRINPQRLDLFRRPAEERRTDSEENRPRWGVRTSNPGGAASRSLVGSTPTLFRHTPGAHDHGAQRSSMP